MFSAGAHSRPISWSGGALGGSTKPPMADNYIDSHGLHAGLGNASYTQFPSVVETKPLQVNWKRDFQPLYLNQIK